LSGPNFGGALHWKTPLTGLMIGGSDIRKPAWSSELTYGPLTGTMNTRPFSQWALFGIYEKNKIMVAGEYNKLNPPVTLNFPSASLVIPFPVDNRSWYGMASYKLTGKLTAGVYDSQMINHAVPLSPARDSMDWVVSGRYDFSQFLYAKAEQHFINGTANYYDANMNPGGLKPTTKLTILKVGVSF
jgi:hypothetical protein